MGDAPLRLKFALKLTHLFEKRRLRQISICVCFMSMGFMPEINLRYGMLLCYNILIVRDSQQVQVLETVAINDVLPLKAARRCAIANVKWFLVSRDTSERPYFGGFINLHSLCSGTLFGSHQRHLFPFVWQSLVGLRLLTSVCNA